MTAAPTLQLVPTTDPARWADACRASGQPVTPFHSYPFLSLAARLTRTWFVPFVVRRDGVDVGVVPWLARRRAGMSVVNQLPFPYMGPLVPEELTAPCLAALRRRGTRHRALVQRFEFPPSSRVDLGALAESGFELSTDSTYTVDTSRDEEALWEGMDRETRRKIRKAEREGMTLTPSATAGETLSRVMEAVYAEKSHSSGYLDPFRVEVEELGDVLGLQSHWAVARRDGVELGCLVTLLYEGRAAGWVGGVFPEHRSSNANLVMYWDAMRWAQGQGAVCLDMVGTPTAGIGSFKKQFGGHVVEYPVLTRVVPWWHRWQVGLESVRSRSSSRHLPGEAAT